jgi:8-oxo-dGTP pyrophosphatase MutT (NUDIX family)
MPDPGFHELRRALHPQAPASAGPGWNATELEGIMPRETRYRMAAVLVGLVPRDAGTQVLFTRRTEAMRHHAGQVSFPGGRMEDSDRGPLEAALREAHEEIGLSSSQAEPLGWLDPLDTITGYRVLPVVARIDPGFVPQPDPGEVAEVFEVPMAYLLEPDSLVRVDIEFAGRVRHVLEVRGRPGDAPGRRIWGATASILSNLRQRIGVVRTGDMP